MKRFAFALWLNAISLNAYADSANCHQKANTPESIAATMDQALQLKQQLNSQPDPVVILVRQGQDMSSRHLTRHMLAMPCASQTETGGFTII